MKFDTRIRGWISLKVFLCMAVLMFNLAFYPTVYAENENVTTTEPHYLFVQGSKEAKIVKSSKPDSYKITLAHVEPWVLYFSDRPHRDMGMMKLSDFLSFMNKEKDKYTPTGLNAALVSIKESGPHQFDLSHTKKIVFTLDNPVYNKHSLEMTYDAKIVPNQKEGTIDSLPAITRLHNVTLFIDACIGCVKP